MKHWMDDPLDPEQGMSDIEDMEAVIRILKTDWTAGCSEDDFHKTCVSCRAGRVIGDLQYIIKEIHEIISYDQS